MSTPWLPVWSAPAAMRAVRAMVVVAGMFALADNVIGNLQVATFAAFGGFATLVLASFAGTRRQKLSAHLALAVAGSVLLTIGTAVTTSTALAAIVTVPVTFTVFFAGVGGPNAAAGTTGALLAYVLPAASRGSIGMVPDRLAGWWLASVTGTAAVLLLSPRPGTDGLRKAAANVAHALADELDAALLGAGDGAALDAAVAAKHELLERFTITPYRPIGLAAPDEALANCVELLEWCTSLMVDAMRERADLRDATPDERELLEAAAAVLRDVASLFGGGETRPDLDRLERCRAECVAAVDRLSPGASGFREAAQLSFHAHAIAVAVLGIGAESLVASGLADPGWLAEMRTRWFEGSIATARAVHRLSSLATAALRNASLRSVWFVNSARAALALAAAVAVADLSSVQHGFWVVLGTLSVLRTNASATGASALRALGGTAIGFVIGGVLLLAIGSDSTALWVALPIAVFVAGYAPGTAPFAVGQAAFTVTVAVLYNLIAPVGWKVGVLRIEDVALGCAVSLAVGVLFWPRGASSVVGDDLADAFRTSTSYMTQAVEWACGLRTGAPEAGMAVVTATRLDESLRGFLSEQGSKHLEMYDLWRLVGGSLRLRFTARSIAEIPREPSEMPDARDALARRAEKLAAWYEDLAVLLAKPRRAPVAALSVPTFGPRETVDAASSSHYGVWLCEHLDHLAEHLHELVRPATRIAEIRRRPWWR